jgi:hypothetical protein
MWSVEGTALVAPAFTAEQVEAFAEMADDLGFERAQDIVGLLTTVENAQSLAEAVVATEQTRKDIENARRKGGTLATYKRDLTDGVVAVDVLAYAELRIRTLTDELHAEALAEFTSLDSQRRRGRATARPHLIVPRGHTDARQ